MSTLSQRTTVFNSGYELSNNRYQFYRPRRDERFGWLVSRAPGLNPGCRIACPTRLPLHKFRPEPAPILNAFAYSGSRNNPTERATKLHCSSYFHSIKHRALRKIHSFYLHCTLVSAASKQLASSVVQQNSSKSAAQLFHQEVLLLSMHSCDH